MITTMIVEDERIILKDILNIIEWEKEGFSIVATAHNGKLGLSLYNQYHPQLVLTDIRMPIMDGLTMLKSIHYQNTNTHFLILSTYNDFEYAKQAIRLGVDDYILKSELSPEYLLQKLDHIRSHILITETLCRNTVRQEISNIFHSDYTLDTNHVHQVLAKLSETFVPAIFNDILEFSNDCVRKEYERMARSENYQAGNPTDFNALALWLTQEYGRLFDLYHMLFVHRHSPVVVNTLSYIEQNYQNPDLKIDMIANAVGLSSGRLNIIIKKEYHKTINEIITQVRVEHAKQLILSGKYKIYEISEMVGYKTSQYFSRVFYQYTQQYPTQYRKDIE